MNAKCKNIEYCSLLNIETIENGIIETCISNTVVSYNRL
jgi:hypothetical protein